MGKAKITKFRSDLISFKKIGLDSMIFIYQFSDHPKYAALTQVVFELLEDEKINAVTSTITITEVFVQPEKEKKPDDNFGIRKSLPTHAKFGNC